MEKEITHDDKISMIQGLEDHALSVQSLLTRLEMLLGPASLIESPVYETLTDCLHFHIDSVSTALNDVGEILSFYIESLGDAQSQYIELQNINDPEDSVKYYINNAEEVLAALEGSADKLIKDYGYQMPRPAPEVLYELVNGGNITKKEALHILDLFMQPSEN